VLSNNTLFEIFPCAHQEQTFQTKESPCLLVI